MISMLPAQFIYRGDLLDGQMLPTEIGEQWRTEPPRTPGHRKRKRE
jgi:hypothetical protein